MQVHMEVFQLCRASFEFVSEGVVIQGSSIWQESSNSLSIGRHSTNVEFASMQSIEAKDTFLLGVWKGLGGFNFLLRSIPTPPSLLYFFGLECIEYASKDARHLMHCTRTAQVADKSRLILVKCDFQFLLVEALLFHLAEKHELPSHCSFLRGSPRQGPRATFLSSECCRIAIPLDYSQFLAEVCEKVLQHLKTNHLQHYRGRKYKSRGGRIFIEIKTS
jgi:hypothetical protein